MPLYCNAIRILIPYSHYSISNEISNITSKQNAHLNEYIDNYELLIE